MLLDSLGPRFVIGSDFNNKHIWWGSRVNNPKGKALYMKVQFRNLVCHETGAPTKIPDVLDPR